MNDTIQSVTPRDVVEVHLPDGKVFSGPRGTSASEFLAKAYGPDSAPLVAVIVNGELRELTFPVQMEAQLVPVTMADADGARIYRRSLTFLFSAAFANQFPEDHLTIEYSVSSGGYFCQVTDRPPLSNAELSLWMDSCGIG
jgi:uridine kinase